MDIKIMASVFSIVFLAELGDKTQLATLLFASRSPGQLLAVFIGASSALVVASAIGVIAGGLLSQFLNPRLLSLLAGAGFLLIGAWTLWQAANMS